MGGAGGRRGHGPGPTQGWEDSDVVCKGREEGLHFGEREGRRRGERLGCQPAPASSRQGDTKRRGWGVGELEAAVITVTLTIAALLGPPESPPECQRRSNSKPGSGSAGRSWRMGRPRKQSQPRRRRAPARVVDLHSTQGSEPGQWVKGLSKRSEAAAQPRVMNEQEIAASIAKRQVKHSRLPGSGQSLTAVFAYVTPVFCAVLGV
jgi:hypothetical protein